MQHTTLRPRPMLKPQGKTHNIVTRMPPTGGLDMKSPLAAMPDTNAVVLDNFVSQENGLALREGYYEYAYGIDSGNVVRTVMSYDASPANAVADPHVSSQLFAATDNGIWLVEGGGNIAGHAAMIALSGTAQAGRMSHVQFTTNGGNFLIACSEIDGAFIFDGIVWRKMVLGGSGVGHITGQDPATFVHVVAWKKRLGFVQRASSVAWFLPVNLVAGAVQNFDFGPQFEHGGFLLAMINWTQSAGAVVDDYLVILGSSGDLSVYEGDDPTTVGHFDSIGTWYIGRMPVGRRNFTTSGGNCYVLCASGLVPVSQIVQGGLDNLLQSQTDMLRQLRLMQDQLRRDFSTSINADGWEVNGLQAKVMLAILRPGVSAADFAAYIFQTHNLAWSRFTTIPVYTLHQRLHEVYGGTSDGRVLRVLDGHSDGALFDGTGAIHVRGQVTPAFTYFGNPNVQKQALMLRPVFLAAGPVDYDCEMNTDFYVSTAVITPIETTPPGSLWDVAHWDRDYWAPEYSAQFEWRVVSGLGYALTPSLYVSSQTKTVLTSIEHMLKAGGPF